MNDLVLVEVRYGCEYLPHDPGCLTLREVLSFRDMIEELSAFAQPSFGMKTTRSLGKVFFRSRKLRTSSVYSDGPYIKQLLRFCGGF